MGQLLATPFPYAFFQSGRRLDLASTGQYGSPPKSALNRTLLLLSPMQTLQLEQLSGGNRALIEVSAAVPYGIGQRLPRTDQASD